MSEKNIENKVEENGYYIKFKKPFEFEDKTYEGIDLTGLEDLSGNQLCAIHRRFDSLGIASAIKEQSPDFACIAANVVTEKPIEFFKALPAKELNRIKSTVFTHFFAED